MQIYTYGIIDSNKGIDDFIKGLEGTPVYNISYRDIGVAVSNLNEQVQDITKEHILEHEEVLESLMRNFTVLPIRFLTVFNAVELLSMIKEYYSDFRENLDRLSNKEEFGIKVIWPGNAIRKRIINANSKGDINIPVQGDSPGKSFIKEKFKKYKIDKEFEEEADRYIAVVDNFFSRFATEKKLQKLQTGNLLLNASYLVEKKKQRDFKDAFEQLRSVQSDLRYLFSGPWPPYNFATLTNKPIS